MGTEVDELPVEHVDLGAGVRAGFTTREGGVSRPPFGTLNLGAAVGDDPDAVAENRARLARWAGAPVAYAHQVHGRDVAVVTAVPAVAPQVDALVSTTPDVAVAVVVADCVPVLLADPVAGVVAAAHAGRRGLVVGVLQATLDAMAAAGADPVRVRAVVGPAVAGVSYEVPAALRDEVAAVVPETAATTSWGTPSLDLPAGVRAVLVRAGVGQVFVHALDTYTDPRLFSYRRSSRTGRFAAVVRSAGRGHEPR